MQYRRVGNSGLIVSEICLGTMTFGVSVDQAMATRIVDQAMEAGVTFFDTANTYANGQSEILLGEALKGRRHGAIVATKFHNPTGPFPTDGGISRVHIMQAIEDSLRRLQMDYIDIYYVHHVDSLTPQEEMLRAVDDLIHQGKVRYVACSNYEAWRLADAWWTSVANGLHRFICYQPQYSLVVREIEFEHVPFCLQKGIGIVPWGPLASGFLTGKYQPGQRRVPGTRSAEGWLFHERFFSEKADETLAVLLEVSREIGKTPAQVALRWVLEQLAISSVIVGARTAEQFRDSCGASGWRLEGEPLWRLTKVSQPKDRYPYQMERGSDARRAAAIKMPSLDG
ncbi:MAG: aldo/keto reductase [Chloroflexi bacterium]|nr:aldo/keto reductase [Chloroflexota bacterium]